MIMIVVMTKRFGMQIMTDNNDWIKWKGGLVAPVTGMVEVRYRNGICSRGHKAGDYSWRRGLGGLTIIAYRVIENDGREG